MAPLSILGAVAALASVSLAANYQFFDTSQPQRWYSNGSPFLVNDNSVFVLQSDGNLVALDRQANVYWNSATTGHDCSNSKCFLQFNPDGNLVLVEVNSGNAYWSTSTNSYPTHPVPAQYLMFQSNDPYIALLSSNDQIEWSTNGISGHYYEDQNPSTPTPAPGPPPRQPVENPCYRKRGLSLAARKISCYGN